MKTERVVAALRLIVNDASKTEAPGGSDAGWIDELLTLRCMIAERGKRLIAEIERTEIDWPGGSERASVVRCLRAVVKRARAFVDETPADASPNPTELVDQTKECEALAKQLDEHPVAGQAAETAVELDSEAVVVEQLVTAFRQIADSAEAVEQRWGKPAAGSVHAGLWGAHRLVAIDGARRLANNLERGGLKGAATPAAAVPDQEESDGPLRRVINALSGLREAIGKCGRRGDDAQWVAVTDATWEAGEALTAFGHTPTKDVHAELDGMGGEKPARARGPLRRAATALENLQGAVETYLKDETPEHRQALGIQSSAGLLAIADAAGALAGLDEAEQSEEPLVSATQDLLREVEWYLQHTGPDKGLGWRSCWGQGLIWLRDELNSMELDKDATYELRHHTAGSTDIWKREEAPEHLWAGRSLLRKIIAAQRREAPGLATVEGAVTVKCRGCRDIITVGRYFDGLCMKCRRGKAREEADPLALDTPFEDVLRDHLADPHAHQESIGGAPAVRSRDPKAKAPEETGRGHVIKCRSWPEGEAAKRVLVIVDMQAGIRAAHDADYKVLITRTAQSYPGHVLIVCGDPYGQLTPDFPAEIPRLWKGAENGGGDVVYAWLTGACLVKPDLIVEVCGVNTNACVGATATGLGARLKTEDGYTNRVRVVLSLCRDDNGEMEYVQDLLPAGGTFDNVERTHVGKWVKDEPVIVPDPTPDPSPSEVEREVAAALKDESTEVAPSEDIPDEELSFPDLLLRWRLHGQVAAITERLGEKATAHFLGYRITARGAADTVPAPDGGKQP